MLCNVVALVCWRAIARVVAVPVTDGGVLWLVAFALLAFMVIFEILGLKKNLISSIFTKILLSLHYRYFWNEYSKIIMDIQRYTKIDYVLAKTII